MGTKTFDVTSATDTPLVTTAETVVATLSGVSTPRKTSVTLEGFFQLTTGTGTTAVTPRIRRGSDITGVLIGEANAQQIAAAAGSTEELYIKVIDQNVDVAGATYVLTAQQTAASANGSSLQATLSASMPD